MPASPTPPRNAPDGTRWFGGPAEWFAMSLRFYGDDLVPEEITQLLQAEPTVGHKRGDILSSKNPLVRPARTGTWRLKVTATDATCYEIDTAIIELLMTMTSDLEIWQKLMYRFRGDLFVGVRLGSSNKGIELLPNTLLAVGQRGLKLGFDIYYKPDPDADAQEVANRDGPQMKPAKESRGRMTKARHLRPA